MLEVVLWVTATQIRNLWSQSKLDFMTGIETGKTAISSDNIFP
jgi:hypothetical protein